MSRRLARSAGFYATRLEISPSPTSMRAASKPPRRPGSLTTTYTLIPTPTPCRPLALKWAALLEYRWRLDIWAYPGPGLLHTPSAISSVYEPSWILQVRKPLSAPREILGLCVSVPYGNLWLSLFSNKCLINQCSWLLLCYSAWWIAISLRTTCSGNRQDNVSIRSCTGLRFTIQPESSKSTLNRPFHGMMHLQTLCSPAVSPLILQVVITGILSLPFRSLSQCFHPKLSRLAKSIFFVPQGPT